VVADVRLPEIARACVAALGTQLLALKAQILAFDRRIMAWHRSNETSKRLDAIPGVGPALATALVLCGLRRGAPSGALVRLIVALMSAFDLPCYLTAAFSFARVT
jgi:transposase